MKTQEAVASFIYNRQALSRRPKTIEWYRGFLEKFACSYAELPMDPEPIEEFLAHIKGTPETKHANYRCLKALYRFVCRRKRLPNPMELIDPPSCPAKVMPTLEPRDLMKLLNIANNLRDKTLLSIFIDTGARAGEIASLKRENIKEDTIKVTGKRGEREIPISDEIYRMLLVLIASSEPDEYVFISQKRRLRLTRHRVYEIVRDYMGKAGIQGPKLGPHRIRHAFGKSYLVNGGDVRSLQQIMGHSSITTTQKYASLNLSDVIIKHNKFTPLRAAHAAAQAGFFDKKEAIKEAEAILAKGEPEE